MEDPMGDPNKPFSLDKPEIGEGGRRDDVVPSAPPTAPLPGEGIAPSGSRPPEDGGVEQHPIHDSDVEDLGPEDFEEMTDEIEKTGITK
jgi:hypothetical protein